MLISKQNIFERQYNTQKIDNNIIQLGAIVSTSESLISASAAGVRGLMIHLKGTG